MAVRLRKLSVSPINSLSAARFSHQTRIHHRRRFTSVKIPAEWNLNDTRERSRWRREPFSNGISNLIMIRSCRRKFGGGPTIFLGIASCRMGQLDHDREIARRNVQSQLREVSMARFEETRALFPRIWQCLPIFRFLQIFPRRVRVGRENVSLKYF